MQSISLEIMHIRAFNVKFNLKCQITSPDGRNFASCSSKAT